MNNVIEAAPVTEINNSSSKPVVTAKRNRKAAGGKKVVERKSSAPRTSVPVNQLGVVDQVSIAFSSNNLFATICGFVLGGIVPVTVYRTAHYYVAANPFLWALVVGGLIYSAITVYKWGSAAFSSPVKSFGFVLLIEGTLTFSPDQYLALAALAILTVINGVATACNLIAQKKEARKPVV